MSHSKISPALEAILAKSVKMQPGQPRDTKRTVAQVQADIDKQQPVVDAWDAELQKEGKYGEGPMFPGDPHSVMANLVYEKHYAAKNG